MSHEARMIQGYAAIARNNQYSSQARAIGAAHALEWARMILANDY